ncbi:hypothetical protein G6F35_018857 [Rhizopus arrhizus]|nr:hypothetical protein G6F35_018857 [Rhizopus arrhizus]
MRQHLASVYSGDGLPSRRPDPLPSVSGMVPFDLDSQDPGMPSFSADSVGSLMRRLPLLCPGPTALFALLYLLPVVVYPFSLASSTGGPHPQKG